MMDKIQGTRSNLSLDFTKPICRGRTLSPAPSLVTPILALSTPDQIKMISGSDEIPVLTPTGISQFMSTNTYNTMTPSHNGYNNNNNINTLSNGQNLTNLCTVNNDNHHQQQTSVLPSPLIPATVDNANNIDTDNIKQEDDRDQQMIYQDQNTNHNHNDHLNHDHHHHQNDSNNHSRQRKNHSGGVDNEKIEKKRERNRLAAKKCRQRKIETIEELKKKVANLQAQFDKYKTETAKKIEQLTSENNRLKKLASLQ